MIAGFNPVSQALLGTLFTWGVTALGSALVFVFSTGQVQCLQIQAYCYLSLLDHVGCKELSLFFVI